MKKRVLIHVFIISLIILVSFGSAKIVITESPEESYNIGDVVNIVAKITSLTDMQSHLVVSSICNGIENNVRSQDIILPPGGEEIIDLRFILTRERLGRTTGHCVVKFDLGEIDSERTNDFIVSDVIEVKILSQERTFDPGQDITISGEAIKETGEAVKNGFVDIEIKEEDKVLVSKTNTVRNGFFVVDLSIPKDLEAKSYLIYVDVYEIDSNEEKTNKGSASYNININQIPTDLEIFFDERDIIPGTNLRVKSILRDQTGKKIDATAKIQIFNSEGFLVEEEEIRTDTYFEYFVDYIEPPSSNWSVFSVSRNISDESKFSISEYEKISLEFLNKSLFIENIGNVFYNDTLFVKLDNTSLEFNVALDIGESKKYVMTAPEGNYSVEILNKEGSLFQDSLFLTGRAVSIRESSDGVFSLIRYPFVWIFIIFIFGFLGIMYFNKTRNKSFFKKINLFGKSSKRKFKKNKESWDEKSKFDSSKKGSQNLLIDTQNIAELSLSIKGTKQDSDVVCVQIKNFKDVQNNKKSIETTLKELEETAKGKKAVIYENSPYLFFILAPTITRTFKNEKNAILLAQKIRDILKDHNKLAKQKIKFGISLNRGKIIAKQEEKNYLKFMGLGNFISLGKKLSSISEENVLLTPEFKENSMSEIKTKKHSEKGLEYYTVEEMRNREETKKFIRDFLDKMKEDSKK